MGLHAEDNDVAALGKRGEGRCVPCVGVEAEIVTVDIYAGQGIVSVCDANGGCLTLIVQECGKPVRDLRKLTRGTKAVTAKHAAVVPLFNPKHIPLVVFTAMAGVSEIQTAIARPHRHAGRQGRLPYVACGGGLLLGLLHNLDMDGELGHRGLPRAQEDGGDDDVVVPRLPCFGEGVQRAVIAHFIELAKAAVKDPDPFQLIEGGKVQPQRLPAGNGSRHHSGCQFGKDLLRAVVLLCDLLLQLGIVVALLQQIPRGKVGLIPVDHANGGIVVHGGIHREAERVLVQALGVLVGGVNGLVVDLQYHDILTARQDGRQELPRSVPIILHVVRDQRTFLEKTLKRMVCRKDPHSPQAHVILRQIQLIAVPRRPQGG